MLERVEKLLAEAGGSRGKAALLNQELDRRGLFHLYEDRLLDLFERQRRPGI